MAAACSRWPRNRRRLRPPVPGGRGGRGNGGGQPQRPARDVRPQPTGTGRISGRLGSLDGTPVRRAQVRLNAPEIRFSRTATTNSNGVFEFTELPAGRYTLTASKTGYLTLQYGQRRPLEPGKPIDLAAGQALTSLDFALPRGSVITGRVVDEFGEPVPDASVQAMRFQYVRRPTSAHACRAHGTNRRHRSVSCVRIGSRGILRCGNRANARAGTSDCGGSPRSSPG